MISECCGAEDREYEDGISWSAIMLCPECRNHCVFISEEEFGNEYAKEQIENALTGDE